MRPGPKDNWTDERINKLKELWQMGFSAAQCAAKIGFVQSPGRFADGGRNAVIGKVFRLGLLGGQMPWRKLEGRPRKRHSKAARKPRMKAVVSLPPAPIVKNQTIIPEPLSLGKSIVELGRKECHWPHGDGPFTFCGHPVKDNSRYCLHHHQRSYSVSR